MKMMTSTMMRAASTAKGTNSLKTTSGCLARYHGCGGTKRTHMTTMRALCFQVSSSSSHSVISKDGAFQPIRTSVRNDGIYHHRSSCNSRRWFETEAEYHPVADYSLETIQDAIDAALDSTSIEYEINLASGVLTFSMPPHGTWVINKQTPNRQIWWSSPLSGPKRFEYDDDDKLWFSTKDGQNLGREIVQEIRRFHSDVDDFEIQV